MEECRDFADTVSQQTCIEAYNLENQLGLGLFGLFFILVALVAVTAIIRHT